MSSSKKNTSKRTYKTKANRFDEHSIRAANNTLGRASATTGNLSKVFGNRVDPGNISITQPDIYQNLMKIDPDAAGLYNEGVINTDIAMKVISDHANIYQNLMKIDPDAAGLFNEGVINADTAMKLISDGVSLVGTVGNACIAGAAGCGQCIVNCPIAGGVTRRRKRNSKSRTIKRRRGKKSKKSRRRR